MKEMVKIFNENKIRVLLDGNALYYSAYDVASALGISDKRKEVNYAIILEDGKFFEHNGTLFVSINHVLVIAWKASYELMKGIFKWLLELQIGSPLNETNIVKDDSKECFAVTQVAKKYGLSAKTLNEILHENHIQYKVNEQWVLYSDYQNRGLTKTIKIRKHGKEDEFVYHTYWTQEGVKFIEGMLLVLGYEQREEQLSMF